jgi:hypothetical protein
MAPADLNILWMPDLLAAAQDFATNASIHAATFHSAWAKVCLLTAISFACSRACNAFRDHFEVAALNSTVLQLIISLQVMNADRFDGPYSNLCENTPVAPADSGGVYSTAQVLLPTP